MSIVNKALPWQTRSKEWNYSYNNNRSLALLHKAPWCEAGFKLVDVRAENAMQSLEAIVEHSQYYLMWDTFRKFPVDFWFLLLLYIFTSNWSLASPSSFRCPFQEILEDLLAIGVLIVTMMILYERYENKHLLTSRLLIHLIGLSEREKS